MKRILTIIAAGIIFLFLIPSCYYDNVEDLYPFEASACDTANVTYSQTIAPIMAANCNICHDATIHQANVRTDNYDDLNIVRNNGLLGKAVNHDPSVVPMPYQGNKLSECNLSKINIWIRTGSPKN